MIWVSYGEKHHREQGEEGENETTFFFISAIFISFDAIATCEIQPKNHVCLTIFTKGTIYSAFPILNNKPEWKWYRSEDIGEYYWQTELGKCKNNEFIPNGARLLIRIGSLRLNEKSPAEGSLQDLLNVAEKKHFSMTKSLMLISEVISEVSSIKKTAMIQRCLQSLIIQSW
jgi:hypothetical protein